MSTITASSVRQRQAACRTWRSCRRTWWSYPRARRWCRTRHSAGPVPRTARSSPRCWVSAAGRTGCTSRMARAGSGSSRSPAGTSPQRTAPPLTRIATRSTTGSPRASCASRRRRRRSCDTPPSSLRPTTTSCSDYTSKLLSAQDRQRTDASVSLHSRHWPWLSLSGDLLMTHTRANKS